MLACLPMVSISESLRARALPQQRCLHPMLELQAMNAAPRGVEKREARDEAVQARPMGLRVFEDDTQQRRHQLHWAQSSHPMHKGRQMVWAHSLDGPGLHACITSGCACTHATTQCKAITVAKLTETLPHTVAHADSCTSILTVHCHTSASCLLLP